MWLCGQTQQWKDNRTAHSAATQRNKVEWNSTLRDSETDQSKQNCVQCGSETEEICMNCPNSIKGAPTSKTRRSTCRSWQTNQMDSADVLYAATQLLFPTCNITITAESYRPRLGMYEVSKLQAWEAHSLKVIITVLCKTFKQDAVLLRLYC